MVVNRWLYRVCTGPWATYVRILPQLSRTASCRSLESSSSSCSTGGGESGSSLRAILQRFGADGPGCGGAPHRMVLLCRSRLSFRPNELWQTSQVNGFGLHRLACRCKVNRRVKTRPHVAHLCIVIVVAVAVVVYR